MTLCELCKEVLELDAKATKGPWTCIPVISLDGEATIALQIPEVPLVVDQENGELVARYRTACVKLALAAQRMEEALRLVDKKMWFSAADKNQRFACSACDVNLHPNCQGVHRQLNGDPCPIQALHDALADVQKIVEGS
jgi:hypothetical protein